MTEPGPELESRWRRELAIAAVAGDLSTRGVARFGGVPVDEARLALAWGTEAGIVGDDARERELIACLTAEEIAEVHAAVALDQLGKGKDSYDTALTHARAAAVILDQPELVRLLITSGRLALASGDNQAAVDLLEVAIDIEHGLPLAERARLLLDLARACEGAGWIARGLDLYAEIVRVAQSAGEPELAIDAAIRSALPPDWRAGDRRSAALLATLEEAEPRTPRMAALLAARAMVEMRIPSPADEDHQFAWVTRAQLAQPMADSALLMTSGWTNGDRLIALLAWRSTHRSPSYLEQRLAVSSEAVDVAQRLLETDRLVDSAVMLAVDQIEAGNRKRYDEALSTVRWAAQTDGNPRLLWWAETTTAGAALLDGHIDQARTAQENANEIGRRYDLPGWRAAQIVLGAETVLTLDDDALSSLLVSDSPLLANPLARSTLAFVAARLGETQLAETHISLAMDAVDEESSFLLCHTLIARAIAAIGDQRLAAASERYLAPWAGHTAVDASGWWIHGPVDLALAELALLTHGPDLASGRLRAAQEMVTRTGDVRAQGRIDKLRARGVPAPEEARSDDELGQARGIAELTDREKEILALIAEGHTNVAIAGRLAYSVSTIRADTVSIYRKLGVSGRAEAVAVAVAHELKKR